MDIISEILETDKLAEQKLEEANTRKLKIGEETQNALAKISQETLDKVAEYKQEKETATQREIDSEIEKICADEESQKKNIDELYQQKHSVWEKEIFERIVTF